MAEHAEGPPRAGGGDEPAPAVGHHAVPGRDAERAHRVREGLGVGQHVRQRVRVVGDGLDVEEDRAGHVDLLELGRRVALEMRQVERGVHHLQVRLAQMGGEPLGGDERIRQGRAHRAPPGAAGRSGSSACGLTPCASSASSQRR